MDDKEKVMFDFICRNCGGTFKAAQGSRRELCPQCLSLAVARELPKDNKE